MILRPRNVAGRTIGIGWRRKNPLEHFDELGHFHFEPGFFGQLARHALLERLADLEHAAGDGPLPLERWAGAADQQGARVVDQHSTHADYGSFRVFSFERHCNFGRFPPGPLRVI